MEHSHPGTADPITARPLENGEYEVISGHRRLHACQKAGIATVPALIYALDRDAAAIALVDSNLHREKILPSEKAFAYKLKRDAMAHQGKTSHQLGEKLPTAAKVGMESGDSMNQVLRYIRLTELVKELEAYQAVLQDTQTQLANAEAEMEIPFAREKELAEKSARLKELNILLNMDQKDRSVLDEGPGDNVQKKDNRRHYER